MNVVLNHTAGAQTPSALADWVLKHAYEARFWPQTVVSVPHP
jgi:hypothetical protein